MIAIADYGLGNVSAFVTIYRRLGHPVNAARTPEELRAADRIVLPGVGSFDWAMRRLNASGMRPALEECAPSKPILGICVGMQMMARRSEEGTLDGLGWIPGDVRRFDTSGWPQSAKLPHMGWNDVEVRTIAPLFEGLETDALFYFLHSYYFAPDSRQSELASASYNGEFTCAVGVGNLFGVQFHPEKSHRWGLTLLANFARI